MSMPTRLVFLALLLAGALPAFAADPAAPRVTVLYDAFGDDPALEKDWGFAALVEAGGKRILFDTGNDAGVFARNVEAKGVDLSRLDAVVMSHRHADHMAGLVEVLKVNPQVPIYAPQEGFGIYGSSLPSSFYRKDASLPPRMRYYDGQPAERLQFGRAWPTGNFKPLAETTEIAPGVWTIAAVSDAPGTRELRELSLAIRTPQGLVLVVGCSHPGIAHIVDEAVKLDPKIHLVVGGFHFVNADDAAIATLVDALESHDIQYIAPGHCTGEPTFAALLAAYGERYLYAGVGAVLDFATDVGAARPRGMALTESDRIHYRLLALEGERSHRHLAHADP
ncbi:MBL fold metallo-hydrolase [Pseudoxanthomonas putridarboris]|uniref:MBL fold metallo-hydrolase n=1 Tax=Pseudoxanthomonas putridarboris TaxID=752605 RepID=A0ABU9J198_9GAMM